jgi:hypothetical protein
VRRVCVIPGCSDVRKGRGWCSKHYQAWAKWGDPLGRGRIGRPPGTWASAANPRWNGGASSHPLYEIYAQMLARCSRASHRQWPDYGGRGITVCARWRASFWSWVEDMGPRPEGLTLSGRRPAFVLDRINNDRGYEPGNCRWTTHRESALNRRTSGWERRARNGKGQFV